MKLTALKVSTLSWRVAAFSYSVIFLTILILAYTGKLPTQWFIMPYFDKIGHVVLYSLATYLGHRVLRDRRIRFMTYAIPLWPFLFGTFTIVEEALQSLSPNRSLDWIDLVASLGGVLLGYWFAEKGR